MKISALNNIANSSGFKEVLSTFKRVANIVKNINIDDKLRVDKTLFESSFERELYAEFEEKIAVKYETYEDKLDALFGLKPEIDSFFENIMVNVEDKEVKLNRHNLIATIYKEFRKIADIKEIAV